VEHFAAISKEHRWRNMSVHRDRLRYALVCGCFGLSGLAALVYQTAWTRQFALVFGTSELAVAAVLAAYMGGLALGARLIESWLPRIARPVRCYAWLELGIGMSAIVLVPLLLRTTQSLLVAWFGGLAAPPDSGATGSTLFYVLGAMATLLVPTTLMGATLPLLARDGVHEERQIGVRIGTLYACNTAGAVAGALATGMVLLPAIGLRATNWTAAGINLLVFGLAILLAQLERTRAGEVAATRPVIATLDQGIAAAAGTGPRVPWILPLILVSGAVSFTLEVLWTRMLQRIVGSSIQSFSVMVASFLFGIAVGGALGARLTQRREGAAFAFALSQLAVAGGIMIAWQALAQWADAPRALPARIAFGFALLLPMTIAIGITYPLAVRVLATGVADAPLASARVYSWNTVGAIVGALAGGFLLIPWLRYEGTVRLAVCVSLLLALTASLVLLRFNVRRLALLGAAALASGLLFQPVVPATWLKLSPLRGGTGVIAYYAVGRSADVVVVADESTLDIRANGLPEAGAPVLGAPPAIDVEAWMSMLAVLARPTLDDMLIVGFGGGNVAQAVPPSVHRVDVIELEPRIIEANRAIATQRALDPLSDSRLNLISNDARGALSLTTKKYDAIVSQPSHPWTAAASHLYTREFMQQAHDHLANGGVFVQWLGGEFVTAQLLRSQVATLLDVFRELRVYHPSRGTVIFMASDRPLVMERDPLALRATLNRAPGHYARLSLNAPEDLLAALALETADARRFAAGRPLITDDRNLLATANVYERNRGMDADQLSALFAPFDPLTDPHSFVHRDLGAEVSMTYIWRRVVYWSGETKGALERMSRLADCLGDTDSAVALRHMMAMHLDVPDTARQLLADGLKRWPNSVALLYAAAEPHSGLQASDALATTSLARLEQLAPEPAAVIRLSRLAAQGQWSAVTAADTRLADVAWTAPWSELAAQLRTEWRLRVSNPELRQRLGDEGIRIADQVLASQPDALWQSLRAWSAAGTNRPEVVLESTSLFCVTAERLRARLSASEQRTLHELANGLTQLLDRLQGDTRIDARRYVAVRARLARLMDLLA
jgi:spermidine synthase